jgi:hypothetical protein
MGYRSRLWYRAIADYVRAGGKLRSASGIITWDEAVGMAR